MENQEGIIITWDGEERRVESKEELKQRHLNFLDPRDRPGSFSSMRRPSICDWEIQVLGATIS